MLKVALRGLLAHKLRMLITFVAVAVGVAFMGGVLVLSDTMSRTFNDLFDDVYRGTDAVVRSDQVFSSDFGDIRGSVDEDLVPVIEGVDGVASAAGSTDSFARIIDRDGDPVGNPAFGPPTFGSTWIDGRLNPFTLYQGRAPETDDEIVIDRGSARSTGYAPGDRVTVQTAKGVGEFELVGVAKFGTADSPGGATFVMWTAAGAQDWIGEQGKFSTISVAAEDGVSQTQVSRRIAATLDADGVTGVEVVTGAEITEETQDQIGEQLGFFTTLLLVFAGIALVVGTFVIYNSFAIIVAQRTRELALLRAIGARRRQVRRAVLVEAVVVGLVGAAVGFVVGLGLAWILGAVFQVPGGGLAIVPSSVVVAVVTGVVVTVVSAVLPAWRASRVAPLAAMRDVAVDRTGRSRVRFVLGVAVLVGGVVTVFVGATDTELPTVGLGVGLVFLGLVLVCPGLARPVSRAIGVPVQRLRGAPGQLARENASRNPRRTSATAQALMIGIGLVALLLVVNASVRASFDKIVDESFSGDFVVDSGTFGIIGLPPRVADEIAQIPDVDVVVPARFSPALVDGEDEGVTGTSPDAFELFDLRVVAGEADLARGEVVVLREQADDQGIWVGDQITIELVDDARPPDERTARVAGVYDADEGAPTLGRYMMGLEEFSAAAPTSSDAQIFVQIVDGATVGEVRPQIEKVVEPYASAEVQSVDDFKDTVKSRLDVLFFLLIGLLFLSVIIAVLGIANTIFLSVLERTRELGLLRAVGMRRRQLRATVRWEAVIISLYGTALGLSFGLVGGWGLVRALRDEGFGVFRLPVGWFVVLTIAGGIVGIVAAVVPAWRAGRMNVLDAIQTE